MNYRDKKNSFSKTSSFFEKGVVGFIIFTFIASLVVGYVSYKNYSYCMKQETKVGRSYGEAKQLCYPHHLDDN